MQAADAIFGGECGLRRRSRETSHVPRIFDARFLCHRLHQLPITPRAMTETVNLEELRSGLVSCRATSGVAEHLLHQFAAAQELESLGSIEEAVERYTLLVADACKDREKEVAALAHEKKIATLATPPPPLIVSMALNSIGGSHLDAREHEEARAAFRQSIEWWPANGMAQTNLADLERERGSYERAIELYKSAAALPKSEWPDVVPSQWFSEWITAPRKECVALATYMSLLLLHQTLAFDEALPYMAKFGVRWRLSPAVWRAVSTPPHPEAALPLPRASAADGTMVRRVAGAIPDPLLSALQQGFSLSSPFWAETDYADRGYFSFWYDVAESPRNAVEFLCRHLRPFTGVGDEVVGCEWWVHTRAEGRSIGHQMHFDTEEGSLASGQLLHPVVSSVSYLRTSADHLFGSDPTVVLNQRVDDDSADRAWVISYSAILVDRHPPVEEGKSSALCMSREAACSTIEA